jgi:hypothetical protein
MGNSLSEQEIIQMQETFNKIMNIPCPILDIGDRNGMTGYIDFISQSEVSGEFMKGSDLVGRKFIVWKAQVIIDKLDNTYSTFNIFTTFFKRYSESTSCTYHTCGHHGIILFSTEGGATLEQMNFLYELLSTGSYQLNYSQAEKIKLYYPEKYSYENLEELEKRHNWIFKIKLVNTFEN